MIVINESNWANKRSRVQLYDIDKLANKKSTAGIYLFKVNNENTTAICEVCSKLTIKMREQLH